MAENEYIDKERAAEETKKAEQKEKKSKVKPASKSSKPSAFSQILNGDFLTREFVLNNLNFIFFIIFLLLLIVGKGYYGKQLSKDVEDAQKELDEMTADYVEAKAGMEEETRRYKLVEELAPRGLVESEDSTKVIRLKKAE
ncbi:MAG: FtsL-like putative cell division protein [Flavobacteriia bacterium]|jgi:hypothetical protein